MDTNPCIYTRTRPGDRTHRPGNASAEIPPRVVRRSRIFRILDARRRATRDPLPRAGGRRSGSSPGSPGRAALIPDGGAGTPRRGEGVPLDRYSTRGLPLRGPWSHATAGGLPRSKDTSGHGAARPAGASDGIGTARESRRELEAVLEAEGEQIAPGASWWSVGGLTEFSSGGGWIGRFCRPGLPWNSSVGRRRMRKSTR